MSKFNVGDRVKLRDYSKYEFPSYKDQICTITSVNPNIKCEWSDNRHSTLSVDGDYCFGAYKVEDNNGEKPMTRRTFKLLKDTADYYKGLLVQEACDAGDQEYASLNHGEKVIKDDISHFFDDNTVRYSRKTIEEQPNWFVEVFKVEPEYMTEVELTNYKAFLASKTKKAVKRPNTHNLRVGVKATTSGNKKAR